jgi:hypothetical protein
MGNRRSSQPENQAEFLGFFTKTFPVNKKKPEATSCRSLVEVENRSIFQLVQ